MTVDPPKIVFPCPYPIKVLGRAGDTFRATVLGVFDRHAPGFRRQDVVIKDSNKGTFQSITVTIEAQSEAQLRLIHQDLMGTGLVSMVI
jgi:putative lipoic acid-binding regulatory protein